MAKSAIEIALDKVAGKKIDVNQMPEPPKEKKGDMAMPEGYWKPRLYLNDKELPDVSKYSAGDKVLLVIECTVESTNMYDRMDGKEKKKAFNADLCIEAIADITTKKG